MDNGNWRARILSQKSRLCELTSLSMRFLDKCVERNVLTRDEKNEIECTCLEYDMKSKFYDTILRKDEKLYEVLVEIMKETETMQSNDVLIILTSGLDTLLRNLPGSSKQIEMVRSELSLVLQTERPRLWFDLVQPLVDVIGRDNALKDLHKLVTRNMGNEKRVQITSQLTCVWGLGGIGKTTLVRKYACDNCDYFDDVIWIKADDNQQIRNSFKMLASSVEVNIQLEDWSNLEANMIKIFKFFSNRKSLFVFDNVEKYDGGIAKFLPLGLGPNINKPYFLMTSRKVGLDAKIRDFNLRVPSIEDVVKIISKELKLQTDKDISIAHSLAVELECLPLAVQQAIAYIQNLEKRKQRFAGIINPIEEYLTLLKDNSKVQAILDSKTADDYGKTVLRTWTTTIKTMSKYETYGPSAERIMNILAYFNHDSINCDILESIYSKVVVEKSLTLLAEYSMIEVNEGFVSIHRLVQQVIHIQNKSVEPELLQECLKILMTRSDTLEHCYTIWKSALNYNDLVRNYPRVGLRVCENVHFGSTDSTNTFHDTSNKFNDVFGTCGMSTLELNSIRIISLCHDMREPMYSLILQLSDELICRLRICNLGSINDILPTLYRLAASLLKIGKSALCPRKKQYEIITHSLNHFNRCQEIEKMKSCPGVNAQGGINECRKILSNISEIGNTFTPRLTELWELHRRLVNKKASDSNPIINIVGPSGVGKTTLVLKYVRNYAHYYYDGVIWINADTKESMELSMLKISGEFDDINLCPSVPLGSWSYKELQLQLVNLIYKLGEMKYLFVFRRSTVGRFYRGTGFQEYDLSHLFNVLRHKSFHTLVLSTEIISKSSDLNVLHLDVFTQDEATKQICDSLNLTDNKLAHLLAEGLHRFPLALHYATEYIVKQMTDTNSIPFSCDRTIEEYLELFEQYSVRCLHDKLHPSDKFEDIVQIVWNISQRKIEVEKHGLEAIKMMTVISYLDPDDFSFDFIHSVDPERNTTECIKILEKYGLLTNWNACVNIHPLLQKIIRKQNKSCKRSIRNQILQKANFKCYGKTQLIFLWNRLTTSKIGNSRFFMQEHKFLEEIVKQISLVFGPTHVCTIIDFDFFCHVTRNLWRSILNRIRTLSHTQFCQPNTFQYSDYNNCRIFENKNIRQLTK